MLLGYYLWQAEIFLFTLAAIGMTVHFGESPRRPFQQEAAELGSEAHPGVP
jgi:hypothetical protein